jgi:hypothetical protein
MAGRINNFGGGACSANNFGYSAAATGVAATERELGRVVVNSTVTGSVNTNTVILSQPASYTNQRLMCITQPFTFESASVIAPPGAFTIIASIPAPLTISSVLSISVYINGTEYPVQNSNVAFGTGVLSITVLSGVPLVASGILTLFYTAPF